MNDVPTDLIIVGQGLAGSAVAMRSVARGYKVMVLDEPSQNRSSVIAAGLFNPITGKNNTKTWMADKIFPALHQYYRDAELLTGRRFFHPMPLYRPFISAAEQNEWMGKSADEKYSSYIDRATPSPAFGDTVIDPFGGIKLRHAGYVNTQAYLQAVRDYLLHRGAFREAMFDPEKLQAGDGFVTYDGMRAARIVFCQGVRNAGNPWFKDIPVNSLKGEFLTMQCDWEMDVILNRGVYMVPDGRPKGWRVGATYNWNDKTPGITAWAREELAGKLQELIRMPFTITGQDWGVRPTSPDRKPIIGAHPQNSSLIIFNGLGTKGVSLAPYFSEVLIRWIEEKGTINKEADVTRFN